MILLRPAQLLVHAAHGHEDVRAVHVDERVAGLLALHRQRERLVDLRHVDRLIGHGVQTVIGRAAAVLVEELRALRQRLHNVLGALDLHAADLGQRLDIALVCRHADFNRRVGTERGQNLHLEGGILGDLLVIFQIARRIVGRADDLHIELFNQPARTEFLRGQHGVRVFPDGRSRALVQRLFDAENALQLQVRPVIQRVPDSHGNALGVGQELLIVVSVAANQALVHAHGAHVAPLVMVAAKEQLGDVFKLNIFRNFTRAQVAMIINDGHFLGILVIQLFRRIGGEKEILVHKRFQNPLPPYLHKVKSTSAKIARIAPNVKPSAGNFSHLKAAGEENFSPACRAFLWRAFIRPSRTGCVRSCRTSPYARRTSGLSACPAAAP